MGNAINVGNLKKRFVVSIIIVLSGQVRQDYQQLKPIILSFGVMYIQSETKVVNGISLRSCHFSHHQGGGGGRKQDYGKDRTRVRVQLNSYGRLKGSSGMSGSVRRAQSPRGDSILSMNCFSTANFTAVPLGRRCITKKSSLASCLSWRLIPL